MTARRDQSDGCRIIRYAPFLAQIPESPFTLPSEGQTAPDGIRHQQSAPIIGITPPLQPSAQKDTPS